MPQEGVGDNEDGSRFALEALDRIVSVPVEPMLNICEGDGKTPEDEDRVGVVPPVTDEDEPVGAPLEEGVLPEKNVAPLGEVGEPWGLEVEDGSVDEVGVNINSPF